MGNYENEAAGKQLEHTAFDGGAIDRFLRKFGEGIQQVELQTRDIDTAVEILRGGYGVSPVYPKSRPGANGTEISRPPLLAAMNIPNYEKRTQMQDVTKHIPRADAKWLGERLSQLSEQQIRDCFRAGGYTQEEVEGYAMVIQNRIAALNAL